MAHGIRTINANIITQMGAVTSFFEKRPGIFQLNAPLYYEDGDVIEIYVEETGKDEIRVSDYGMALMRLSYHYELNSDKKREVLHKIIRENHASFNNGNIYIDANLSQLHPAVMHLAQVVAKVSSMRYFGRETVKRLFFEMLAEYVVANLQAYNPIPKVRPIPNLPELEADFSLRPNGKPYYLFAINSTTRALLATILCQQLMLEKTAFGSILVYEDLDRLSKKDRNLTTRASDKQFNNLEDFKQNIIPCLSRIAS